MNEAMASQSQNNELEPANRKVALCTEHIRLDKIILVVMSVNHMYDEYDQ